MALTMGTVTCVMASGERVYVGVTNECNQRGMLFVDGDNVMLVTSDFRAALCTLSEVIAVAESMRAMKSAVSQ
jgi:hypothetical protein